MSRLMTAAALRRWRHERDITQRDAAKLLDIPYDTYRAYETGLRRIPRSMTNTIRGAEAVAA